MLTERWLRTLDREPRPVDEQHMSAMSCLGVLSALHHRGFYTMGADGCPTDTWLEVWWLTDTRTGEVVYVYEDTRGLNRPTGPRHTRY